MDPGTLTKVLHDFLTTVDCELSLGKGEYFLIHKIIDKHWYYGQSRDRIGKFPSRSLLKIDLPSIQDTEDFFITIADFCGEQSGDLSFSEGEIIVGVHPVEQGWYMGYILDRKGIFPITHTWKLDKSLLKKPASKKNVHRKAKVKVTMKAQLDDELDLTEGEIVTVTEIKEDGWCCGKNKLGKKGIFPEGFICYLDESTDDQVDAPTMMLVSQQATTIDNTPYLAYGNIPCIPSSYTDEPAPSYYDLFPKVEDKAKANDDRNSFVSKALGEKPHAISLYPFHSQYPNELSFDTGEIIQLTKHVDSDWLEGIKDDKKGIFPKTYVHIIVNCSENDINETLNEVVPEFKALENGTLAKVEYSFNTKLEDNLNVSEGEIVTVVEMANADWVNIKNENGETGFCPRSYLSSFPNNSLNLSQPLEDLVILRKDKLDEPKDDDYVPKRLSEPHRPAPPTPVPEKLLEPEENVMESTFIHINEETDEASRPIDNKHKKSEQRQNIISELVITEKEFIRDLKITYETFNLYNPNMLESYGINVPILFGNILEVIQVAEELLDVMLRSMKGCDEREQTIGPCFIKMADKLETTYFKYCMNQKAASNLLTEYQNNPEIQKIFEKGLETLRCQITCFNMGSILIKPVQRIGRYPLFLEKLVKSTDDDHADKASLEEAFRIMINVNSNIDSNINEFELWKSNASKFFDNESTLMRKMAKLNMHSVAKMSTRISMRISTSLGLTNVQVDPEFEEVENQFKSLEKCTQHLTKDIEQSIAYLIDVAAAGEVLSNFLNQYYAPTVNDEIKHLMRIRFLYKQFINDLKTRLEKRVSVPLHLLLTLLEGPAVLITKRRDKLLDYDAAISRSEKYKDSRTVQDELSIAKQKYESLNQQLIKELPIFINAATKILINCLKSYTNERKLLSGKITKLYLDCYENVAIQMPLKKVLEAFIVNHNILWNQIERITFCAPNVEMGKKQSHSKLCPQNEQQRLILRKKYPLHRLYVVTENVISSSQVELSAAKGTIVAVIKPHNPMGDPANWFMDDGQEKGFLPSQKLHQIPQMQQIESEKLADATNKKQVPDLICMDSPEKELQKPVESHLTDLLSLNIDQTINKQVENRKQSSVKYENNQMLMKEFYYAAYDFNGNIERTLKIKKGQALRVITRHDDDGNNDWWLMENRNGEMGYVPRNFLKM
ncbi:rho guanine nucleotide exchange factor 38-like [Prorops nasuta]|uniref:rho guanine nucleotide exchange factor 38-like n=1 Tax=Prorops nasuta TaxID=863751 RepID=UPI0034CF6E0D